VIGALGSRLLPPFIAMARGSVRTMFGSDPFELLEQDHRSILSLLDSMEEMSDDSLTRRSATFLAFKRSLGKHAIAEEDVVYPLLYDKAGSRDAAKRLYSEHAEMKIHMYQIESALDAKSRWKEHVRSVHDLIRRHIRDEEEAEFPRLRAILDEQRGKTLSGKIHREEALVL